jgi:sugar phosphate isomerase/epimerase
MKVYAQIYSLIRQQRAGLLDALKIFAGLGYDGVELISDFKEGLSLQEFKAFVQGLGLDVVSVMSLMTDEELAFGLEMGARYTVPTFPRHPKTYDELAAFAEQVNAMGRKTAKFGLKTLYHNHSTEFIKVGDTRAYDILLQNTDPDLVSFEFDIAWGQLAGVDCAAYIRNYPGRFSILHVKECAEVAKSEDQYEHFPPRIMALADLLSGGVWKSSGPPKFPPQAATLMYHSRRWNVELGKGLIRWEEVRDAAVSQGVAAFVNEREYYHIGENRAGEAVVAADMDLQFLRKLLGTQQETAKFQGAAR